MAEEGPPVTPVSALAVMLGMSYRERRGFGRRGAVGERCPPTMGAGRSGDGVPGWPGESEEDLQVEGECVYSKAQSSAKPLPLVSRPTGRPPALLHACAKSKCRNDAQMAHGAAPSVL